MKKRKLQKIMLYVGGTLLSLILLFNIYIILQSILKPNEIPSFLGYKPFIVASSSMENTIYKGDLLIVKKESASKVEVDDIIAYKNNKDYIVHRVFSITNEGDFETKGDNNTDKDDYVVSKNSLEGVYKARIPYLGSILLYLSKTETLVIILLTIGLLGTILLILEEKKK